MFLDNQSVLITGGTGSLGKVLTRRILSNELGKPKKVIIFSRDEAKQHFMRMDYLNKKTATDEIIYNNFKNLLEFRIGDIRDYRSVAASLKDADIVINVAALKQVPTCEYFPQEAVFTNIDGAQNIVRAIEEHGYLVKTVVGVSTDKACKPINVMGMTKSIQERIFIRGNLVAPNTRFICVRYGNVLASRGSVIPLFHEQIKSGGPLTITTEDMTRFLLSLDMAVDTIFASLQNANRGETFIPKISSARIVDVARALIGNKRIRIDITGIRPGEKIHEILVSEEESVRTVDRGNYYVIQPILPELKTKTNYAKSDFVNLEYSSRDGVLSFSAVVRLLKKHKLMVQDRLIHDGEFLK